MYQALYRKWRPKVFDDVVSQPHITKTLQNELQTGRVAHAYLFTGSRGTGKTSCARILAKAVNCLHPKEDGSPCLECDSCIGIEQGSILDVVEIDAASNNSVDDIRELREEANFTPSVVKYRVYIIDEVHMLSNSAFNALLKIMEEPPAHVIFILATTEVYKVPATILSRCQRFDFRRVRTEDIKQRVEYIAKQEKILITDDAAELIARIADGGMRDALSLLDQCIAFTDDIDADAVSRAAGIASRDYLFRIANAVEEKNASAAIELIDELYSQSRDLVRFCEELVTFYRNLMLVKTVKDHEHLINCLTSELAEFRSLASKIKLSDILYVISELQLCLERVSRATGKRIEVEMCMIRLCTPGLSSSNEAVLERLDHLESEVRMLKVSGITPSASILKEEGETELSAAHIQPILETAEEKKPEIKAPETASVQGSETEELTEIDCWAEILAYLSQTDAPLHGMLVGSRAFVKGDACCIDSPNTMLGMMIKQNGAASRLSAAIQQQLGRKYRLMLRPAKSKHKQENPLDSLAESAQKLGINVKLEE